MAEWFPKPDEDGEPEEGSEFLTDLFGDSKVDVGVEAAQGADADPAKAAGGDPAKAGDPEPAKTEQPAPKGEPAQPAGDEPAVAEGDAPAGDDDPKAGEPDSTPSPAEAELAKLREEWGELWLLAPELRQIGAALRSGNNLAFIEGLEKLSPTRTDSLVQAILDAKAEQHVASKYKLANVEALGQRLGTAATVEIPKELEAILGAMPDEQAKAVRDVFVEAKRAQAEKDAAFSELEKARGAVRETFEQQAEAEFKGGFEKVQVDLIGELVPKGADEDTVTSIRAAMLHRFLFQMQGPDGKNLAEEAISALEESTLNRDSDKLIEANRQRVADLMEKALRKELASRGLKPAEVKRAPAASKAPSAPAAPESKKGTTASKPASKPASQGKAASSKGDDLEDYLQNLGIIPKAAAGK